MAHQATVRRAGRARRQRDQESAVGNRRRLVQRRHFIGTAPPIGVDVQHLDAVDLTAPSWREQNAGAETRHLRRRIGHRQAPVDGQDDGTHIGDREQHHEVVPVIVERHADAHARFDPGLPKGGGGAT
jgi:hypothetical protein